MSKDEVPVVHNSIVRNTNASTYIEPALYIHINITCMGVLWDIYTVSVIGMGLCITKYRIYYSAQKMGF